MWQTSLMGKASSVSAKLKSEEVKCADLEKDIVAQAVKTLTTALDLFPDNTVVQISASIHQAYPPGPPVPAPKEGDPPPPPPPPPTKATSFLNVVINPIPGFVEN